MHRCKSDLSWRSLLSRPLMLEGKGFQRPGEKQVLGGQAFHACIKSHDKRRALAPAGSLELNTLEAS